MNNKTSAAFGVRSDALLAVADGMRLYRVAKPVPTFYGWNCEIGDTLPFPAHDNEDGWRDVSELSGCSTARMWVRALIGDGVLVDITDTANVAVSGPAVAGTLDRPCRFRCENCGAYRGWR